MGNGLSDAYELKVNPPKCEELAKASGGKIRWFAFSTMNCQFCREPSAYESAEGALCHTHADQYISGAISLGAKTHDVFSESGVKQGSVEITEYTTVEDLKAMLESL